MGYDIAGLRSVVEKRLGKKEQLEHLLSTATSQIKEKGRDLRRHEQAREIIREVGLKTQQQLQYHISEITTLALSAVFPDPYELIAEFVQRRNKTECDLYFVRGEERADPLSASGGGAVDVASFALRVASWSMCRPRLRNVLLLDEPFKHLSASLLSRAGEMIKQLSEQLGLQVVMVTHSEELAATADRQFTAAIRKRKTEVRTSPT